MTALLVALGAAVGAPLRLLVNHELRTRYAASPEAGTLAVNVAGSFVLGLLAGYAIQGSWLALIGTGFCGALTTFSTLALELWTVLEDRRWRHLTTQLTLTLTLGLGAAYLGFVLTR